MIGWRTALKFIPWKDVLQAAPSVLNGARQLWQGTHQGNAPIAPPVDLPNIANDPIGNLKIRVVQLEKARYETGEQVQATTDVVQALAEQQQQLISEISKTRLRLRIMSVVIVVLLAAVIKLLIWG